MKRKPSVAGGFYPGERDELRAMIKEMTVPGARKRKALAVVAPHAGYIYSGRVAGAVFSSVEVPATCLLLGPAHGEIGPLFAIQSDGSWQTPLGESSIDKDLAARVLENCELVEDDPRAHLREHSIEVELPFLQYFRADVAIVPVSVSYLAGYEDLVSLGRGAAAAIRALGREVLIVASTDMSHYVSRKTAEKLDMEAVRRIVALDAKGLFETVRDKGITMCGFQPTTAALVAARELGAVRAELVKYATSGDRTGDFSQVVGYAGLTVFAGRVD
jgi:AmmeMemoRadiSam system protein B